jgi:hypothetical protein
VETRKKSDVGRKEEAVGPGKVRRKKRFGKVEVRRKV